jgi:hypothetical protein
MLAAYLGVNYLEKVMAKITEIVFDCLEPSILAGFWERTLDDFNIREYDDHEITKLAAQGLKPESDPQVALDGPHFNIFFQISKEAKRVKNRIHLDICAGNREPEVQRLEALGASVRDIHETYTVMLDPEGNEFCVTD